MITIYLLLFILGTCFSSFIYCVALRSINGETILSRSHCEYCLKELKLIDLIPIISYLINKGRCRYCKHELNKVYLIIELIGGIIFLIFGVKYKLSIKLLEYLILIIILMSISIYDYKTYIIPDILIILGIINRLVFIFINKESLLINITNSLLIGIPVLIIRQLLSYIFKKEEMGLGDIYLLFMLGFYVNTISSYKALLISSLIGLLISLINKKKMIAFGPCICIGYTFVIMMLR